MKKEILGKTFVWHVVVILIFCIMISAIPYSTYLTEVALHSDISQAAKMIGRCETLLVILIIAAGECDVASIQTFPPESIEGNDKVNACVFPKSWDVLFNNRILIFEKSCVSFKVMECYCLTADKDANLYIGECFYGCLMRNTSSIYYEVNISSDTCSLFNRRGILCGQCKDGYGVPAYSFSLRCVTCGGESLWITISRYILVAYGPLTVFLALIVVFTFGINSAPLRGWILVCQVMSNNVIMRLITGVREEYYMSGLPEYCYYVVEILGSLCGVWNLNFFRSMYKPFCLHSSLTTLQVMSLEYIVAAYPLLLIVVMYVMVEMYSRNYRPMVLVGKCLHHCCIRFRHELDIRTSLIDAFGTFFSLSFVKFISTTADLVVSTKVWDTKSNTAAQHLYFYGSMEPFKGSHVPFAIFAILVTMFFNILPLVILLLYSFPRGQIVLKFVPGSVQNSIYPFVDNILACYKDGTGESRNCRYFSVVYHIALFAFLVSYFAQSLFVFGVLAYICIVVGMLLAVIQPYKSKVYNTVDIIHTLSVGLGFVGTMSYMTAYVEAPFYLEAGIAMSIVPLIFPLSYFVGLLVYKSAGKLRKCLHLCHLFVNFCRHNGRALLVNST